MWTDLFTFEAFVAFLTLTGLEVVLGIDNVIFIAILAGKLPESQRDKARRLGLLLAVVSRVILVLAIGWVIQLKNPLFSIFHHAFTGKDLILLGGGLFLIAKATYEIHHKVHAIETHESTAPTSAGNLTAVLVQVLLIDVVFSLDSVITAVGMTEGLPNPIPIMIAAILASVAVMLAFSKAVVTFVDRNPSIKILALSFLLLIGVLLVAEGFHHEIPKGYVYFAMAFSLVVDLLQLAAERRSSKKPLIPSSTESI